MSEQIASGSINIEVNDRDAIARLHAIDSEFDRAMARIDRQHAEAKIGADLSELDRDLKEAEAKVKEYDKRIAATENNRSKAQLRRNREVAKAEAEAARERLNATKQQLDATKKQNSELTLTEKRVKAIEDAERKRAAVHEQIERKRAAAAAREQREAERLERMRERDSNREAQRSARAAAAREKEIAAIPKMQRQYAELAQRIDRLNAARGKTHGDERARLIVDLKVKEAVADMAALKQTLERLGSPIDLDVDLHPGRDAGVRLRNWFSGNQGGALHMASAAGVQLGAKMGDGLVNTFKRRTSRGLSGNLKDLGRVAGGGVLNVLGSVGSKVGKGLEGLSSATIRLGPFTTSIRGAISGLSILAPLIIDLVGALGSLIGLVGSAAVGLGALGVGVLGGAIPAFLGMGLVVKGMVNQFSAATKASKAYNDAVMKGNTDLAKKKLKELHTVLGNVDESTVKAFTNAQKMNKEWTKATAPGRAAGFNIIGQVLRSASDLMPQFAARTNQSMRVAEQGTTRWMKALRSTEGKGILDNLMGNFNKFLGPVLGGLGNLVGYLGRVANLASNRLPALGKVFEDWSKGILHTSDDTVALNKRISNVLTSLKDVGKFSMASGRFLKAFFNAGTGAGQDFSVTMTKALSRWTADLNTPQGAAQMQAFFKQSVTGAQAFYNALAPVLASFVRWAQLIAPLARAFFDASSAIGGFVSALLSITALRGPLTAIATTLGVLWGVSKISAATRALTGFASALFGVGRAQAAVAATSAATNVAATGAAAAAGRAGVARGVGMAEGAAAGAAGARAAAGLSRGAKAAGMFRTALTGVGSMIGIANPLVGAAVLTVGALAFAFSKAKSSADKAKDAFKNATKASTDAAMGYRADTSQLGDLNSQHLRAGIAVKQLREQLAHTKKGTDEYKIAQMDLRDAQRTYLSTGQQLNAMQADASKKSAAQVKSEKDRLAAFDKRTAKELDHQRTIAKTTANEERRAEAEAKVNNILNKRAPIEAAVERAMNRHAAANANVQRSTAGFLPVLGAAEQKLGALARQSRGTAMKVAMKFEAPKDVGRVAASASKSLKAGVPNRIVTRIVADSRNADDAVKRLSRVRISTKIMRVTTQGGREAVNLIERLAGRKLTPKEQRIVEKGGNAALGVLSKILGIKLPTKNQHIGEKGSAAVIARLSKILGIKINDKTFNIIARDQASGVAGKVRAIIGGIPRQVTVDVKAILHKTGSARAAGRPRGMKENAWVGEGSRWQGAKEYVANAVKGTVTKVVGPTPMALSKDDFVIPTEARHKQRGRGILSRFAQAMGMSEFAGGYAPPKVSGGYYAPTSLPTPPKLEKNPKNIRRTSKGFAKRRGRAYKSGRGYVKYIADLKTQQDDWEREASIRESQVDEPTDLMVEIGRIKDPLTGDDLGPQMGVNAGAIKAYQDQMTYVSQAYDKLLEIVRKIVEQVPNAQNAISVEETYRHANIKNLTGRLKKAQHRADHGKSKETRAAGKREVDKITPLLAHERDELGVIQQDRKTLTEDAKDAGFSVREYDIKRGDIISDRDAIQGRAEADVTSANASVSGSASKPDAAGGGATGGGDAAASNALSYGQQTALMDAQGAAILKNFGSNFNAGGGYGLNNAPNVGALGQGNTQNPASLVAQALTGSSASTAMSSGGAVSNAMQQAVAPLARAASSAAGVVAGVAPGGGDTNVTVNNTFAAPPPDPHTWSQGVGFEIAAAV